VVFFASSSVSAELGGGDADGSSLPNDFDGAASETGKAAARLRNAERRRNFSIGARLAAVVLVTGAATFGVIGALTAMRLNRGLNEQGAALSELSEQQMAEKLDGEARLARARLDMMFAEAGRQVRALAQRSDVMKAVASENDVTIRELFAPAAKVAGLDLLLAVAPRGHLVGASTTMDLLRVTEALGASDLGAAVSDILGDNNRVSRRNFQTTRRLGSVIGSAFDIPDGQQIGHIVIDPVFDDFGTSRGRSSGCACSLRSRTRSSISRPSPAPA
jgi:hypothetical protein